MKIRYSFGMDGARETRLKSHDLVTRAPAVVTQLR